MAFRTHNGLQEESELTPFLRHRAAATDKKARKEADKFSGSFQQQMDCGSSVGGGLVRERAREEAQRGRKH